jgi:hypothetical protein
MSSQLPHLTETNMANPDSTGHDAPLPLAPAAPLPPLLAAFLFSRMKPGAADAVAAAVLRVASEKYTTATAEGKPE